MNLGDLQKIGQKATNQVLQATQSTQETASGLTGKAIRSAVDQAIGVLQIAAQQAKVKEQDIPANKIAVGASINIGIVQLSLRADVPLSGDREASEVQIDVTSLPSSLQN